MDIRATEDGVAIKLDYAEARRLWSAIFEGTVLSPAEYYIRTGLSKSNVLDVLDRLDACVEERGGDVSLPLAAGVEADENPRRPRPPR